MNGRIKKTAESEVCRRKLLGEPKRKRKKMKSKHNKINIFFLLGSRAGNYTFSFMP